MDAMQPFIDAVRAVYPDFVVETAVAIRFAHTDFGFTVLGVPTYQRGLAAYV